MSKFALKPNHKPVKDYYAKLARVGAQLSMSTVHEGSIRAAFDDLIEKVANAYQWNYIKEYRMKTGQSRNIALDGAIFTEYQYPHGHFEAKDDGDDLEKEVRDKFEKGYPRRNILFWQPSRVILVQEGKQVCDFADIREEANAGHLLDALRLWFDYSEPILDNWTQAVEGFRNVQRLYRSAMT